MPDRGKGLNAPFYADAGLEYVGIFVGAVMRMGGDTGATVIICFLLGSSWGACAQPLPSSQPPSVPPPHIDHDPHFKTPLQAANDPNVRKTLPAVHGPNFKIPLQAAKDSNVIRAQAATAVAEQSNFGKLMSGLFRKRALLAGLRGPPQAIAVGLALDAAFSYFLSEDTPSSDAGGQQGGNEKAENRTWGEVGVHKGLLNASDVEVALDGNQKIALASDYEVTDTGDIHLKTADGSIVFWGASPAQLPSVPSIPVPVVIKTDIKPFQFHPSPVYGMEHFSCASDVYIDKNGLSDPSPPVVGKYTFSYPIMGAYGNDITALAACIFYREAPSLFNKVTSFAVKDYKINGFGRMVASYPTSSDVKITYKYPETYYDPHLGVYKTREKEASSFITISLTDTFERRVSPQFLWSVQNDEIYHQIQAPLAPSLAANMLNNTLIRVASSEDYQGIPFSTSTPVTAEEIEQVAYEETIPLTKGMLYQKINYVRPAVETPFEEANPSEREEVKPFSSEEPDVYPHMEPLSPPSMGSYASPKIDVAHPAISAPTLEAPPTGQQILAPLLELFPFIKGATLPVRHAPCPVAEFEVFERHIVMKSHCELLEKNRALLALFSGIFWAFLSLRLVLSA